MSQEQPNYEEDINDLDNDTPVTNQLSKERGMLGSTINHNQMEIHDYSDLDRPEMFNNSEDYRLQPVMDSGDKSGINKLSPKKIDILKSLIKYFLSESILSESKASAEAKKLNLRYKGFAEYTDDSGKVVAKTQNGKLVKINHDETVEKPEQPKKEKSKKAKLKKNPDIPFDYSPSQQESIVVGGLVLDMRNKYGENAGIVIKDIINDISKKDKTSEYLNKFHMVQRVLEGKPISDNTSEIEPPLLKGQPIEIEVAGKTGLVDMSLGNITFVTFDDTGKCDVVETKQVKILNP